MESTTRSAATALTLDDVLEDIVGFALDLPTGACVLRRALAVVLLLTVLLAPYTFRAGLVCRYEFKRR